MPFPFTSWEHTHAFEGQGSKTLMKDSIIYGAAIPDVLVHLLLKQMFPGRKKEVHKYFNG